MMATYPATYRNAHGEEHTQIEKDGQTLRMIVRGVELVADDPDSFSPMGSPPSNLFARLPMSFGYVCSYVLDFDVTVYVVTDGQSAEGLLRLRYDMGEPRGDGSINRGLNREDITASLTYNNLTLTTAKSYGLLEEAVDDIQVALPAGTYLKVCLNCVFGLEGYGCGVFASLGCFRDEKEQARQVKSMFDVIRLWDRKTEFVQGLYVCPQFERRLTVRV